jgi:hypothetical protein
VHRHTAKWITAIAAATVLLLAALATSASARSFSTSERSFRATFAGFQFASSGVRITCRVTLEGSFHTATMAKVANALVGAISRGIVAHPCTSGEAWIDNGTEAQPLGSAPQKLPFHIQYESFVGSLPEISYIRYFISRLSFVTQATVLGLTCRGRYGRPEDAISVEAGRGAFEGEINSLALNGIVELVEQLGPSRVCSSRSIFSGIFGFMVNLSNGAKVTVTLI